MEVLTKHGKVISVRPTSPDEVRVMDELITFLRSAAKARGVSIPANLGLAMLNCDGCGGTFTGGYSARECRALAEAAGWVTALVRPGFVCGADYCPKCRGEHA